MRVLVVNAGSSTLKLAVLGPSDEVEADTTLERWGGEGALEPIRAFLDGVGPIDVVGHRVVHGGPRLSAPAIVDEGVIAYLTSVADLAPLHNPPGITAIQAVRRLLPDVPAVACFDTAFHASIPAAASTYPLPREWNQRWGLRRYGFHGLSHAYAAARAASLDGRPLASLRVVTCHLGGGSSLCAVRDGHSVDTTMGFTPLEGLMMVTRSGTVDPGLLLWLQERGGLSVAEVHHGVERSAGLAGMSGTSGDLRDVAAARAAGSADAALAWDVFVHRLVRSAGAMVASCGGLDVLVFTGGIGEHQAGIRQGLADGLAYLGVALDPSANLAASPDVDVSAPEAAVRTVVVAAREDLQIAREARATVGG